MLPVWGRPRGDRELMRHVKATLDPKNVFNPGRLFVDADLNASATASHR